MVLGRFKNGIMLGQERICPLVINHDGSKFHCHVVPESPINDPIPSWYIYVNMIMNHHKYYIYVLYMIYIIYIYYKLYIYIWITVNCKRIAKIINQQTDDTDGNVVQLYTIKCTHQMVIIPSPCGPTPPKGTYDWDHVMGVFGIRGMGWWRVLPSIMVVLSRESCLKIWKPKNPEVLSNDSGKMKALIISASGQIMILLWF